MERDELKQFHATFFEEVRDHVQTLEERLLELESNPSDIELLNALFRAAHSVKGSSGLLGFETIMGLTHSMENLLEALRGGTLKSSQALTSLLLEATDLLGACVESAKNEVEAPSIVEVVQRLDAASDGDSATGSNEERRTWTIDFRPHPPTFAQGLDPAIMLRELAALGEAQIRASTAGLPPEGEFDPEHSYLGWTISLTTDATEATIREVFLFVEDLADLKIELVAETKARADALSASADDGPRGRTVTSSSTSPATDAGTLRVTTEKIDRLVNLVGELVIAQAMIARSLEDFTPSELPRMRDAVTEMERHTRELQDRVMNIRMIPIGSIFSRFRRLIRDLSGSLGKEIELQLIGEDTELDKSMVDHLADPLMHLVRNAADHGLDTVEERRAAGKSDCGRITLSARHQGGNVIVDVSEDGRGLDTKRIRAKAVANGLISEDDQLSDEQIHELIFAPGFSTAAALTDVSGRGVGMDVVKRTVTALGGDISITTEAGKGTRFRLSLPLTLAILDGMSLRVGQSTFVLPLNQVIETLSLSKASVRQVLQQGEVIMVRGEARPLVRLARLLSIEDDVANPRPLAVVVEAGELHFALMVDELLGKSQYVIKSLEPNLKKLDGMLGATILGDGTVALILDVPALARIGSVRIRDDRATPKRLMPGHVPSIGVRA
jgi:two-component system chemotaxis sensor kinase CheA